MDFKTVYTILSRFKKEELENVAKECGLITGRLDTTGSKKDVINRLLRGKTRLLTRKLAALADLIYYQTHFKSKKWDVYQLDEEDKEAGLQTDAEILIKKLQAQFRLYFKHDLCIRLDPKALWIRLGIHERNDSSTRLSSPNDTVYLVVFPRSYYLITSRIKIKHQKFVIQSIMNALGCKKIHQLQLSGRHVMSLADLVHNKSSQGWYSQFRLGQMDKNPLSRKRKRKQRDSSVKFDNNIITENRVEELKKAKMNNEAFGSNPQPKLDAVSFKMKTSFHGKENLLAGDHLVNCQVEFKGTDVITGLQKLGPAGLADLPLPSYLQNLHSLSRNHFFLTEKKKH